MPVFAARRRAAWGPTAIAGFQASARFCGKPLKSKDTCRKYLLDDGTLNMMNPIEVFLKLMDAEGDAIHSAVSGTRDSVSTDCRSMGV
jgi:hypothetical protein